MEAIYAYTITRKIDLMLIFKATDTISHLYVHVHYLSLLVGFLSLT